MTKDNFISKYGSLITNSWVIGFKFEGQFPLLEFKNEKENKNIIFHIDCKITSNNSELSQTVNKLKLFDKDSYEIAYFIAINRKEVTSIMFSKKGNLRVLFENNIQLDFNIIDDWIEPLSISVLENNEYKFGCDLFNDGTIE